VKQHILRMEAEVQRGRGAVPIGGGDWWGGEGRDGVQRFSSSTVMQIDSGAAPPLHGHCRGRRLDRLDRRSVRFERRRRGTDIYTPL
jgi:hypothetical protein